MSIQKERFGQMPDGRDVISYTLTNQAGVSASFITLGGVWTKMLVPDRKGEYKDVVLGYDTVENYLKNPPHFGAPIGRNANRIGGAEVTVDQVVYPLAANDGLNNLHSGPDFYHSRLWDSETRETEAGSQVIFYLDSPDGDQGFPGNARISVSYTLKEDNSLVLEYSMTCDQDTVANLTNHSYFNLAGHECPDILNQQVQILADFYTPADRASISTGEILRVEGTPMDFRQWKAIGKEIREPFEALILGNGYDHNWVLNHDQGVYSLAARAKDPDSGRVLEVYTDLPGIQFYTGNFLKCDLPGKDGAEYGFRHGYCFETQYFPDAVHRSHFLSPILKAGETLHTVTAYRFTIE